MPDTGCRIRRTGKSYLASGIRYPASDLLQRGKQFLRVFAGVHLSVDLQDFALFIDNIGDAFGIPGIRRLAGAVFHADVTCRVAQKRVREAELLCKCRVFFHCVKADPEYLHILLVVILDSVAEPATFGGSTGCVRFGVKPEDHFLAPIVRKIDIFSGVIFNFELRGAVTDI